ncbi:hypothetical protein ACIPVB_01960 [Microbacterium sp. NPDC090007]|uniref:hypothetical protein n=1 Tax=Microbacterium sp. NPDC090007 TaxID=3364204 RepID=UPI0038309234
MMQHAVAGGISGVLIVAVVAIPLGFIMVVLHRRTAATRRAIQVDVPHSTVLTMSVESSSPEAKRWLRQLPASDKVRVRLIFHLAVSPSEVRLFGPRFFDFKGVRVIVNEDNAFRTTAFFDEGAY